MRVTEIWRFPVKSMGGETLTDATVSELGINHDRGWGVFHPASGTVLTGRREPKLLLANARVLDGKLSVAIDNGVVVEGDPATMSNALSDWLGYRVELRRAGSHGGTYECPVDVETEQEWFDWTGPPDAWHDSARTRVSILSASSTGHIDHRRFRANIIIDAPTQAEEAWVGSAVQMGSTETGVNLAVTKQIERCVMVARPQQNLGADLDALRWVIRERSNHMGVGATVTKPGRVSVGDGVAVVT